MARVQYGSLVSDISGSIGGHTLQRNAYGASIRQKPMPPKSVTASQAHRRIAMSTVLAAYAGMSQANKVMWDNFSVYHSQGSKHNPDSSLSGYNLFLKYNLLSLQARGTILTNISYKALLIPDMIIFLSVDTGPFYIDFSFDPAVDDSFFMAFMSPPLVNNVIPPLSSLRFVYANYLEYTSYDISSAYSDVFGSVPAVGQFVCVRFTFFGTLTPVVLHRPIVTYPL